jgi:dihydroceramidase
MQPWVPLVVLSSISCLTTSLYYFSTPDSLSAKVDNSAASSWGFWGRPTAEFNWCERDYVHSYYVAETWNTFTSLLYILPALYGGFIVARSGKLQKRHVALMTSMVLVGLGSAAFHATLLYKSQLLDELPMFYLVQSASFILVDRGNADSKKTNALGAATASLAVGLSAVLLLAKKESAIENVARGVLTLGFTVCFIHIFYASCKLSKELEDKATVTSVRAAKDVSWLFEVSFWSFILAIVCWIVDILRCDFLQTALPFYPQLHALGWHVFSAFGTFPLLVVFLLYSDVMEGNEVKLLVWPVMKIVGAEKGKKTQ